MERQKPNIRGLFWLTMGVVLFAVLAMTGMVMLAHFGFGAPLIGNVILVGVSAVVILVLLGFVVALLQ